MKIGNACVVTPLCVTLIETPPSVALRGNDSAGLWAGPRFSPNIVNTLPRAMGALGSPKGAKEAALYVPWVKRMGCWANRALAERTNKTTRIDSVYYFRRLLL